MSKLWKLTIQALDVILKGSVLFSVDDLLREYSPNGYVGHILQGICLLLLCVVVTTPFAKFFKHWAIVDGTLLMVIQLILSTLYLMKTDDVAEDISIPEDNKFEITLTNLHRELVDDENPLRVVVGSLIDLYHNKVISETMTRLAVHGVPLSLVVSFMLGLSHSGKLLLVLLHITTALAEGYGTELAYYSLLATLIFLCYHTGTYVHDILISAKTKMASLFSEVYLFQWCIFLKRVQSAFLLHRGKMVFFFMILLLKLIVDVLKTILSSLKDHNNPDWLTFFSHTIAKCCATPVAAMGLSVFVLFACTLFRFLVKVVLPKQEPTRASLNRQHELAEFLLALGAVIGQFLTTNDENRTILFVSICCTAIHAARRFTCDDTCSGIQALVVLRLKNLKNLLRHFRVIGICVGLYVFPFYYTEPQMNLVLSWYSEESLIHVLVQASWCLFQLNSLEVLLTFVSKILLEFNIRRVSRMVDCADAMFYVGVIFYITQVLSTTVPFVLLLNYVGWSSPCCFLVLGPYVCYMVLSDAKTFLEHTERSHEIGLLSDASDEQLQDQDTCQVCLKSMDSAKVTRCNHLFHHRCLRTWMYVQHGCPTCHRDLVSDA